jgi:DHA2 family multidrug resistance protein-like MFS transporter
VSAEMLIVSRALLGIAGATLAPSTLSLIFTMFQDPGQRSRAIAVWISALSAGSAIGPLLGGVMLEFFLWGSVFLLALPVMAVLLILGPFTIPEYKDPDAGRLDLLSVAMSLVAVLSLIFGLKQVAQDGFGAVALAAIAIGAVFGFVFVRRQRTLSDPLIDLGLFRAPGFTPSLAIYGLGIVFVFGGFLFLPQFLQLVLGLTPLQAGLWTLPWALAFVVGSQLTPRLVRRFRAVHLMAAGLALAGLAFAILTRIDESTGFAIFVIGTVMFSLGLAPVFTLTNDLIIGSVAPERAGAAAGLSETSAELGGALGIAFFGSIGVAIYRGAIADGILATVPAEASEAARDTLGGAVEVAGDLPAQVGVPLLDAARDAFVQGVHVSAWIAAIGAIVLAFVTLRTLRDVRPSPEVEVEDREAESALSR